LFRSRYSPAPAPVPAGRAGTRSSDTAAPYRADGRAIVLHPAGADRAGAVTAAPVAVTHGVTSGRRWPPLIPARPAYAAHRQQHCRPMPAERRCGGSAVVAVPAVAGLFVRL